MVIHLQNFTFHLCAAQEMQCSSRNRSTASTVSSSTVKAMVPQLLCTFGTTFKVLLPLPGPDRWDLIGLESGDLNF